MGIIEVTKNELAPMPELKMRVREVFGTKRAYPMDSMSVMLLELAGTKSFSEKQVELIRRMGFGIEFVPDTFQDAA